MELTPISLSGNVKHSTPMVDTSAYRAERARRYDSALDQFIVQNGRSAPEQAAAATFVDEDGLLRYVDTWKVVGAESDQKHELSSTGCVSIPVKLNHDVRQEVQTKSHLLSFMLDYQILWRYFEKDSVDELAEYAPLFHAYIEICFHPRTVQLMIFMSLYYLIIQFSVDQYYCAVPVAQRISLYIYISIRCIVYLTLLVLFKGKFFSRPRSFDAQKAEMAEKANRVRRNIKRNTMARWIYFAQEAVRTTSLELQRIFRSRDTTVDYDELNHTTPFYDALNVAAKFLSKHQFQGSVGINLNSPRHNFKLFFVFFGVPLYCFMATYIAPAGSFSLLTHLCHSAGQDSGLCNNLRWIFILTLGYSVVAFQMIIFMSSVLLTLTALGFGSEIGRGLIDSWIARFGPLRRLNNAQLSEVEATGKYDDPTKSAGEMTPPRERFASTPNAVVNELHKQLEKQLPAIPAHLETLSPVSADIEAPGMSLTPSEILPYLPRDAYEHYLFVREFMCTGSRSWSPIIIALTFLCTYFVALFVSGAVLLGSQLSAIGWFYYISWVSVRVSLLIIYPVVSLAYANSYVYALQEQFLVAAPEDFAALGGRDAWLEYLGKVPAVWTIYGLVINWDRLSGLMWTLMAALGAAVISFATSGGL